VAFTSKDEEIRKTVLRKVAWRVVPLLAFAYFMASLERANLGIAALSMNESLGLTSAAFGLAAGLFFIGYFVFEVPSNIALARFGARRWLARIALTWGVVAAATAAVQGPASLYVMRILLGIAEAGLFPGVIFYFTLWFPARDRAKMLALFTLGGSASGMFGPPLSGAILSLWPHGLLGLENWRALFLLEGLPSILVGLLIWRFLVDRPDKARWLSAEEKAWLAGQLEPAPERRHSPLRILTDIRVLLLSVVYFAKNCGGYALVFFTPQLIKSLSATEGSEYSTFTISMLSAIPPTVGLVVGILWAVNSDRMQERRWHAAIPLVVGALGVVWAAMATDPILLLAAITVAGVGIGSMTEAFFQLPSAFLAGPAVAVGIAAINATGNLGGFVGPYVFGVLQGAGGSLLAGNLALAGLLVVGAAIIFLPMFRPERSTRPASDLAGGHRAVR
jgi:MFS transporter, ACS family, tartrate transporter